MLIGLKNVLQTELNDTGVDTGGRDLPKCRPYSGTGIAALLCYNRDELGPFIVVDRRASPAGERNIHNRGSDRHCRAMEIWI
jgi:hypothetical protein